MTNKTVVSLDVAKDEAMIGLFCVTEAGEFKTMIKQRKVKARRSSVGKFLDEAKAKAGDPSKLSAIMESTGVYHKPFMSFLEKSGLEVVLLNPTISKRFLEKNGDGHTSLRENKDDKVDCAKLAQMFFSKDYNTQHLETEEESDNRSLVSRMAKVNKTIASYKNTIRQMMIIIFPGYEEIFSGQAFFSKPSLSIMKELAHPEAIIKSTTARIAKVLSKGSGQKRKSYAKLAERLREAAKDALVSVSQESDQLIQLRELIGLLETLCASLESMKERLVGRLKGNRLFKVCTSFPGVGEGMGAAITALIGDIGRFSTARKLIAYMGIDPRRKQSGSSIDRHLGISKRGSPIARHVLFMTVQGILMSAPKMKGVENKIFEYYKKKRSDASKHYYALVIACSSKLLRMIFGRYKDPSFKA